MTVLTMKAIVVLLGLITTTVLTGMSWLGTAMITREELRELGTDCAVLSTQLTGVAAVKVRIRAYNATGNIIPEHKDAFSLGTRVLLTCDVTEVPEGDKVVSYRWFHNCTGNSNSRCKIGDGDPYYRVVSDTLLVDVISQDQGGRYYCFVTSENYHSQATLHPISLWQVSACTNVTMDNMVTYTIGIPQVILFPSSTHPPPSSLSTLSSLMYNRQQGGMDNSG